MQMRLFVSQKVATLNNRLTYSLKYYIALSDLGLRIISTKICCNLLYRGADKSLARTTSRYVLFDGYIISFDASPGIDSQWCHWGFFPWYP